MSSWKVDELVRFVRDEFTVLGDPAKAGPMAAYMKTEMPFYGIQKPDRIPVYREMKKRFVPPTRKQYSEAVTELWNQKHREEKYAAIEFAKQHKQWMNVESIALYESLIRSGAWWDLVDDVTISIITEIYLNDRDRMRPYIEKWIDDQDLWIRRTAILAHNHHKDETDHKQLFAHILRRADEKEFFIRKAIGWALREYSYANPSAVLKFLLTNKNRLSPLSFREASKGLIRNGHM